MTLYGKLVNLLRERMRNKNIPVEDQILMAKQFQLLTEIRAERETKKLKDG